MTKDANDLAKEFEIRERRQVSEMLTVSMPRRTGRVMMVKRAVDSDTGEASEVLISDDATLKPFGDHYLIADDDEHRYFINLARCDYVEFWVRDEGE